MILAAATHVVVDQLPADRTGVLDVIPAVTAAIAALSAAFSWRSVQQARRIWQLSLLPVLSPILHPTDSTLRLVVANTSKTLAANAGWAVLWGRRRAEGWLEDRHVGPDGVASADTMRIRGFDNPTKDPKPVAIVWCQDARGDFHVWTTGGEHSVLKRTKVADKAAKDLLAMVLNRTKDVEDATDATRAGQRVTAL